MSTTQEDQATSPVSGGVCNLINLTSDSRPHSWIIDLLLESQKDKTERALKSVENGDSSSDKDIVELELRTKYYNALVKLKHFSYVEDDSNKQRYDDTEALLMYCDGTQESLRRAQIIWQLAKENDPAVCLFIVDTTKDTVVEGSGEVTRTQILSWCLDNNFELVECDEVAEDDNGSDDEGGIVDIVGKGRILEALKSHTWSTMKLLDPPPMLANGNANQERKARTPGTESNNMEASMDSFEALFSELAVIKAKADNLPLEERRAYAEKIALSFYAAMGGGDSEDEED